jgi:hypothetical protein
MSATARKHEHVDPLDEFAALDETAVVDGAVPADESAALDNVEGTEYATRGAKGLRAGRPHLRMVSPLRAERASRGVFALVVTGLLILGMIVILVINTSLAQGAFTVSELQAERATLTQQEQTLSQAVAAAAAPESLEQQARALGMVPSETPVFLRLPGGKVVGKPKAAPGGTSTQPRLLTPADATATEAVDNASVGTDLPIAPGVGYDPAAVDAAAAQAAAANAPAVVTTPKGTSSGTPLLSKAEKRAAAKRRSAENSLWRDTTVLDMTSQLSSNDAGLIAVPVP